MRRSWLLVGALLLMGALAVSVLLNPFGAAAVDLEVGELVAAIKRAIADAQHNVKEPTMRIPWLEAEVSYVVKKEGSGGLKMYVVTAGGGYATETVQRITYRLVPTGDLIVKAPREISGRVVGVDHAAGKVFIGEAEAGADVFAWGRPALGFRIKQDTKIVDGSGAAKTITDLTPGTSARVMYVPAGIPDGPAAHQIVINP